MSANRPREELIGTRLGHYRIVRQLGQGGMAEVFLAEDLKLKRQIALKVLPSEFAEDRDRLARFKREAESVARLNHPNIVTVYSIEEIDGIHFITMELVEGRSLESAVPSGGFELKRFLKLAEQMADALAAAHQNGIIHRDLKPANVMLTREGRVKILDFGLAKVEEDPLIAEDPDAPTMTATQHGTLVGTVPYMSPEQLQGAAVDARSDIFSLGLTMFEMLSGRPAFQGKSSIEKAAAILHDEPPKLTELRDDLPRHLGRILQSCLEKDPEERVQSAKDLRNQLAALRDEFLTGPVSVVDASSVAAAEDSVARPRWPLFAGLVAAAILIAALVWLVLPPRGGPVPPIAASADSLAVLYFRNLTGDAELDWLSGGLTEMLVTDLSQVPELRLVGTERLYSILDDLGALEAESLGAETVAEVARRAGVKHVLVGSFARVGDELRISARLQDAASGEILDSSTVSDRGESRLFDMIDRLSSDLRRSISVTAAAAPADRPVEQVLTSSVEALRLYSKGLQLHVEGRDREAIPLFEGAVEADPGFSMALVRLATASANLGYRDRARGYTERALEGADRLPPRYRHYVEAQYYGGAWETYGEAIEAYERAVEADPNSSSTRNLLGMHLLSLERFDEAMVQYETARRMGDSYLYHHFPLALAHASQDRWQEGFELLERFTERYPENWQGHWALGWYLTLWDRPLEAAAALDRSEALHRDDLQTPWARWQLAVAKGDFAAAERHAAELAAGDDAVLKSRGLRFQAINRLFQGRARDALDLLEEARASTAPGADLAAAHNLAAEIHLVLGEPERALEEATSGRLEGDRSWPERRATYLAALSEEALDRSARADALAGELERRNARYPTRPEERQIVILRALLSGMRGDSEAELAGLVEAESMLPPRGVSWHTYALPAHATVWYELGRAQLEAGAAGAAVGSLSRLVSRASEHLDSPLAYGRALFLLGKAHSELGQHAEARRYLERFVELWGAGDMKREWVDEARRLLAAAA